MSGGSTHFVSVDCFDSKSMSTEINVKGSGTLGWVFKGRHQQFHVGQQIIFDACYIEGLDSLRYCRQQQGSKRVEGEALEKWNDGWKKGNRDSKAMFTAQSSSISVEALYATKNCC